MGPQGDNSLTSLATSLMISQDDDEDDMTIQAGGVLVGCGDEFVSLVRLRLLLCWQVDMITSFMCVLLLPPPPPSSRRSPAWRGLKLHDKGSSLSPK